MFWETRNNISTLQQQRDLTHIHLNRIRILRHEILKVLKSTSPRFPSKCSDTTVREVCIGFEIVVFVVDAEDFFDFADEASEEGSESHT
jgi:hypothetical protein